VSNTGPGSYGDAFADVYDRWYADVTDVAACVARVAELAAPRGGNVLELGAGTGRLALPLAAHGLAVTALDASDAMIGQLRTKPGAADLRIVPGDMARLDPAALVAGTPDGKPFGVVLIAYNTLFNLAGEGEQLACLHGVAACLAPEGRLVIEAFVPTDDRTPSNDLSVSRVAPDEVVLTASVHDPETQVITGQHVQITEDGTRLRPWRVRYLRPAQLDELAASAGLALVDRCGDWAGAPFDEYGGTVHISTYTRAKDRPSLR
jgi:SAM-dependent methyltransferase